MASAAAAGALFCCETVTRRAGYDPEAQRLAKAAPLLVIPLDIHRRNSLA